MTKTRSTSDSSSTDQTTRPDRAGQQPLSTANSAERLAERRLDGPHRIGTEDEATDAPAGEAPAVDRVNEVDEPTQVKETSPPEPAARQSDAAIDTPADSGPAAESIRLHAEQLAEHLRNKQRELDRREAETNARIAQLENELRASRLWLREKVQQHNEQQQQLEVLRRQLKEESQRAEESANAAEVEELKRVTVELQQQLSLAQQRIRELEPEAAKARTHAGQAEARIQAAHDEAEQRIAANDARMHDIERLFDKHLDDLEAARVQFETDREAAEQELDQQRESLEQRRQRLDADTARRKDSLDQRQNTLEQREAAVEELQIEVSRVHRETLEMRLVTQQLWSQVVRQAPPAELSRAMAQLRGQLAQVYKVETDALADKHQQLAELAERLENRQQDLSGEREELLAWHTRRQQEIEEQAARLVAREQELHGQEEAMRQQQDDWKTERRQLQAELRRVLAQRHNSHLAAA
ncbi:MAG: hypothetical protein RIC55_18030 [Pirellulaceae bacterium]